jgi:hypothetical protein
MKAVALLLVLCAAASAANSADAGVGLDWGDWEPAWKFACWRRSDGAPASTHTPAGYCRRLNGKCSPVDVPEDVDGDDDGGQCVVMHGGWCVRSKFAQLEDAPADVRCHAVTKGELEHHVNGRAPPNSAWLKVCFDQSNGVVVPHLKPDGFCGVTTDHNGNKMCVSYGCEDGAACESVSNDVCSCVAPTGRHPPPGHVFCAHMTAAELGAIVRGPLAPHSPSNFPVRQ